MNWSEVEGHLPIEGRLLFSGEGFLVLSYHGTDDQRLRVERVHAFAEPWLLFLSPIVDEARAYIRDALTLNMRLAIGALAIEQGYLVLRALFPLQILDLGLLDRHVSFVVGEALRLRRLHGGEMNSGPGELFRD